MGAGAAWPIPRVRCRCPQCSEARADARFARGRTGILVEGAAGAFLLDASADIYRQLEGRGLECPVDVVISHGHADHCYGLGDAVAAGRKARRLWGHATVVAYLKAHFGYLFGKHLAGAALEPGVPVPVAGIEVTGFDVLHTRDEDFVTYGFLLAEGGHTAFVATDFKGLSPEDLARAAAAEVWIMDGSGFDTSFPSHMPMVEILALRERSGGGPVVFTHVGHLRRSMAELRRELEARTRLRLWIALDGASIGWGPEGLAVQGAV